MNREESSANAPTNDGKSEGECLWPRIQGPVESTEDNVEETCKWPDDLDRYSAQCVH